MRPRIAAHTALGTALALAITLTSAVAPAFAATAKPRPVFTPTEPVVIQPGSLKPEPKPESSTVTFQPDIRVNYLGQSAAGGGKVAYRFRVQNIGAASAGEIGLGTVIGQDSNDGSVSTRQEGSAGKIASLGQDESKEITVTCTPLAGSHCGGARLTAYLDDDLDESNNHAGSH
jgi:hypothetical protein